VAKQVVQSGGNFEMPLALHVPYSRLREIVDGKRGVSADTALRLERSLQPDSTCRLGATFLSAVVRVRPGGTQLFPPLRWA